MFVLPWMLLALGHDPRDAALATAFVYVPLLVTAIPAGCAGDDMDRFRVLRLSLAATLAGALVYPVAVLVGWDWLRLRPPRCRRRRRIPQLHEADAVMRGIADTTQGAGLLRAHAVRTTVNQAALFGSPFLGLLLFRVGGADAVLVERCRPAGRRAGAADTRSADRRRLRA